MAVVCGPRKVRASETVSEGFKKSLMRTRPSFALQPCILIFLWLHLNEHLPKGRTGRN
jgi:hypothetical protein